MSNTTMPLDGNAESIQVMRPRSTQVVSYTAAAGSSSAFTNTVGIRIYATSLCHVEISPSAATDVSTSSMPIPAGGVEYFYVNKNDVVAAVQNSAAGSLYITEMS